MNNFEYDKESDCAYLRIHPTYIGKIETFLLDDNILIDRDLDGNIIGVELLWLKNLMREKS